MLRGKKEVIDFSSIATGIFFSNLSTANGYVKTSLQIFSSDLPQNLLAKTEQALQLTDRASKNL